MEPMRKITKKQSTEMCLDLWDRLAETGDKYKSTSVTEVLIKEGISQFTRVRNHCFACEYVAQQVEDKQVEDRHVPDEKNLLCKEHCPLIGLWPEGCEPHDENCLIGDDPDNCDYDGCCEDCEHHGTNTAWTDWREADNCEDREKFARVIADYCRKLLAEME